VRTKFPQAQAGLPVELVDRTIINQEKAVPGRRPDDFIALPNSVILAGKFQVTTDLTPGPKVIEQRTISGAHHAAAPLAIRKDPVEALRYGKWEAFPSTAPPLKMAQLRQASSFVGP
jgi:hypothetical protein